MVARIARQDATGLSPLNINSELAVCTGVASTVIGASFRVSVWPIGEVGNHGRRSAPLMGQNGDVCTPLREELLSEQSCHHLSASSIPDLGLLSIPLHLTRQCIPSPALAFFDSRPSSVNSFDPKGQIIIRISHTSLQDSSGRSTWHGSESFLVGDLFQWQL
jgi:hypothetical protein